MLLSIVVGTYTDVKGRTQFAETVASQARETYRRFRMLRAGKRVTLGLRPLSERAESVKSERSAS